jgi:uncharacterized coiled-coil protein SlyX
MASTEERLARLEEQVQEQWRGFGEVRDSIRHLEQRFDGRFASIEQRFQHLEQRVDVRFDVLEQRYNSMINAQMVTVATIVGGFAAMIAAVLSR